MAPRIYTSVVSVGSINIYQVLVDPNGILTAPLGSLAVFDGAAPGDLFQNTDGGTTWVSLTTGAVPTENLIPMGETVTSSDIAVVVPQTGPTVVAKTMVFTAPEDLTVRKMVYNPNLRGSSLEQTTYAYSLSLGGWAVAGTGPDAGLTLIDGLSIPAGTFSAENFGSSPQLDIRMDAGDTLTLTVYTASSQQIPYNVQLLYAAGIDATVTPKRFIAGPAPAFAFAAGSAATGLITVVTTPLDAPGPATIRLNNTITDFGALLDTGGTLTGITGARTSGSNDFDASTVGATAMRDEILAALSDGLNQFAGAYVFTDDGGSADRILVTRLQGGSIGNSDVFTVSTVPGGGLTVTGAGTLTGGSSLTSTVAMSSPSVDTTLESLYVLPVGSSGLAPELFFLVPPEVSGLTVNAAPVTMSPQPTLSGLNAPQVIDIPLAILSGDALVIAGRSPASTLGGFYAFLVGTAT